MKRFLKYLSFGAVGVILPVLVTATLLEKFYGTRVVVDLIYSSPWVIALWMLLGVSSFTYILVSGMKRLSMTFGIHLSFLLILAGALVTHIWGIRGQVHLREDAPPTTVYFQSDGQIARFPFAVSLKDFFLEYYQGTFAPMDYVSVLSIVDNDETSEGTVSMNNIFRYKNWRFYQSGYDADEQGTTLTLSYDPYGIGITYAGYIGLLVCMIGFFFQKKSAFRSLLKKRALRRGCTTAALIFISLGMGAENLPRTLSREAADDFGNLYVYYNNRICPLQTLAKDFTVKLCGKPSYKGLTSEQVLAGWLFFYEEWKHEPMIRIKEKSIRGILRIEGDFAALTDFSDINGYKLTDALKNNADPLLRRAADNANEKYNLISMVHTGSILKIFPSYMGNIPVWYSFADDIRKTESDELNLLYKDGIELFLQRVRAENENETSELFNEIKKIQHESVSEDMLPSAARFEAEKIYNSANYVRPLTIFCIVSGVFLFILYCRAMALAYAVHPLVSRIVTVVIFLVFLYLTLLMAVRGYIGGYLPLSNGFETMVFMAWCSLLLTLLLKRRFFMSVPFGLLLCGLTLMVAMMGETNPKITQLIPVLQSPLLSIHVVVIMTSYSLFAFAMLNGVTALVLNRSCTKQQIEYLAIVSRLIIYPAVFLLTIGIFVGAVWANVSWGRYWGWDPKEVWALITLLVYSLALHSRLLSPFNKPMFVHIFSIVAFFTVLITYFGVNFILGGMHSYV